MAMIKSRWLFTWLKGCHDSRRMQRHSSLEIWQVTGAQRKGGMLDPTAPQEGSEFLFYLFFSLVFICLIFFLFSNFLSCNFCCNEMFLAIKWRSFIRITNKIYTYKSLFSFFYYHFLWWIDHFFFCRWRNSVRNRMYCIATCILNVSLWCNMF